MPWRPRIDAVKIKRQNDELTSKLIRTREQLENRERYIVGLEVILNARLARISELNDKLERIRAQNRALDEECERLVAMVKFAQPADTAMLAPE